MQDGEFANVGDTMSECWSSKEALELISEINRVGDNEQRLEEKNRMRRSQPRHRPNPS